MQRFVVRHQPQAPPQLQVALYTGKGRLKPLPRSLHRHLLAYRVVLITRKFPSTKASLLRLLTHSHGLISFDPLTNLSLESAILGVPTFLPGNPFPARCYRCFPTDLRSHITDSPGAFITMLQRPGPVVKLAIQGFYRASACAADLIARLTADPEPIADRPRGPVRDAGDVDILHRHDARHVCLLECHGCGVGVAKVTLKLDPPL